jgi:hypothetical protein
MSEDYKAPPGMFRVIGVDQFSHEQWVTGDYATKEEALQVARTKTLKASEFATDSSIATVFYAYDDQGKLLG